MYTYRCAFVDTLDVECSTKKMHCCAARVAPVAPCRPVTVYVFLQLTLAHSRTCTSYGHCSQMCQFPHVKVNATRVCIPGVGEEALLLLHTLCLQALGLRVRVGHDACSTCRGVLNEASCLVVGRR